MQYPRKSNCTQTNSFAQQLPFTLEDTFSRPCRTYRETTLTLVLMFLSFFCLILCGSVSFLSHPFSYQPYVSLWSSVNFGFLLTTFNKKKDPSFLVSITLRCVAMHNHIICSCVRMQCKVISCLTTHLYCAYLDVLHSCEHPLNPLWFGKLS